MRKYRGGRKPTVKEKKWFKSRVSVEDKNKKIAWCVTKASKDKTQLA
jgi:hypothetical protein